MSLVHEALQKAERERQRKLGLASSTPAPSSSPTQQAVHAPVSHPPATMQAAVPVTREPVVHHPVPSAAEPKEANHFLLPALIGCVAIVAIIAIVFLVSNASFMLRQNKEPSSAPAVAAAAPAAMPTVTATAPSPASPPATESPATVPAADTTAPANVPPPAPAPAAATDESKYKLTGIMKDPDGKVVALLNGHMLNEGSDIDGATVEKIDSDRVTLNVKGQPLVLQLH